MTAYVTVFLLRSLYVKKEVEGYPTVVLSTVDIVYVPVAQLLAGSRENPTHPARCASLEIFRALKPTRIVY